MAPIDPPARLDPPAPQPARPFDPRWGVVAVAVLCLATVFWPRASSQAEPPPNEGGFLFDAGGRPTPIATEMKPVTLVHFWATWCAPCVEELPKLLTFASGVADERFGLLLVAVNDQPEEAKKFLGSERFPLLFDPSWEVAHRFSTEKLPETHVVIGGEVVESFIGASDWASGDVQGRVLRWLQGRN